MKPAKTQPAGRAVVAAKAGASARPKPRQSRAAKAEAALRAPARPRSGGQVLSVASECVGLLKTGGLADVVGALPAAMAGQGWQLRTLLPAYRGLAAKLVSPIEVWRSPDLFGGPARIMAGQAGSLDLLLLEAPHLYDRPGGPYGPPGGDFADNPERFAALSWVAADLARAGGSDGWQADILHAHDWQAGLAPAYLRYNPGRRVGTVLTIHNMAFQGTAPAARLSALRLPMEHFHSGALEYWGQVSTLKAGLVTADKITTVSPTYAEELMRPEFGMGLHGVVASRAADLHGILNGVDLAVWDPEHDPECAPFSASKPAGKARNRTALLAEFELGEVPGPLAVLVSRLTGQKGIDLVIEALPAFVAGGGGLVVLGSGEASLEQALQAAVRAHPGRVGLRLGYDEDLSHRLFAGGDAVLVPSRFEPCGLTQLYGLRYGALPVVAATGGLNDTVIGATAATLAAKAATGISFHPVDGLALGQALHRLLRLYADRPEWAAMRDRAMRAEIGWDRPAAVYSALYQGLVA